MRSELVTGALKSVPNRYLMAHLAAKATRAFHRPKTRVAETANEVFLRLSLSDPMAHKPKLSNPRTTELRQASSVADSQVAGLGLSSWPGVSAQLEARASYATTGEPAMYPVTSR
jgi:hypothetical protein